MASTPIPVWLVMTPGGDRLSIYDVSKLPTAAREKGPAAYRKDLDKSFITLMYPELGALEDYIDNDEEMTKLVAEYEEADKCEDGVGDGDYDCCGELEEQIEKRQEELEDIHTELMKEQEKIVEAARVPIDLLSGDDIPEQYRVVKAFECHDY